MLEACWVVGDALQTVPDSFGEFVVVLLLLSPMAVELLLFETLGGLGVPDVVTCRHVSPRPDCDCGKKHNAPRERKQADSSKRNHYLSHSISPLKKDEVNYFVEPNELPPVSTGQPA